MAQPPDSSKLWMLQASRPWYSYRFNVQVNPTMGIRNYLLLALNMISFLIKIVIVGT